MSLSDTANLPQKRFSLSDLGQHRHKPTIALAILVYGVVSWLILKGATDAMPRFKFDPSHFMTSSLALQTHVASALTTFAIGVLMLTRIVKGSRAHKRLGWTWVVAMGATAISSFFLVGLNGNSYSFIHGLSAWTVITLPFAIAAVRRGKVQSHAKEMTGLFINGMLIAGLFSFLPGRLLWHTFFFI